MNLPVVSDIASHLAKVSEDIKELSNSMTALGKDGNLFDMYEDMLLDRVKEAQKLFVTLTHHVLDEEHEDDSGSVFAEGELTTVIEPDEDDEE